MTEERRWQIKIYKHSMCTKGGGDTWEMWRHKVRREGGKVKQDARGLSVKQAEECGRGESLGRPAWPPKPWQNKEEEGREKRERLLPFMARSAREAMGLGSERTRLWPPQPPLPEIKPLEERRCEEGVVAASSFLKTFNIDIGASDSGNSLKVSVIRTRFYRDQL